MKKKVYGLLMTVIMVICLVCGTITAFSCGPKKETASGPEVGVYYYDSGKVENVLTMKAGNVFTFVQGEEESKGTYKVDKNTKVITLTFAKNKDVATAVYANDQLSFTYHGETVKYIRKIIYTVTYETSGGSTLQNVEVVNGKTVQKPTVDPKKDGYLFIGWYKDAGLKEAFNFNATAITADTTIYAGWVEYKEGQKEYKVYYVVDGKITGNAETLGGVVFNLPTPEKENFVGWWISDYEDAKKLTAQYVDQKLTEDTTLYAVFGAEGDLRVSVDESGIKWNNVGTLYNVEVVDPNGDSSTKANIDGTLYKGYNFKTAGDYVITVTTGKKSATVYYRYNALDRVSSFNVINGSILNFSPVEGAEGYYITVLCGNEDHKHTEVFNGTSTTYNFANCDMRKGGIKFTVTAKATGKADSVAVYYYSQDLEEVENLNINDEAVTWDAVENAAGYEITVNGEKVAKVKETSYSVKEYTGELTVTVKPVAKGYNSPEAKQVIYTKTKLATPTNVALNGYTLTWDAVAGATGYNVKFGSKQYTATTNSYVLTQEALVSGVNEYAVAIQAKADKEANNSVYCDAYTVKNQTEVTGLKYKANVVSWDFVFGAKYYVVKVNDGEEIKVEGGKNYAEIQLTKEGENTVAVKYADGNGYESEYVDVKVTAYEYAFDTRGGEIMPSLYLAKGDKIVLKDAVRQEYEFAGWYNVINGAKNNGTRIVEGEFDGDGNTVIYAYWTAKSYVVTYSYEGGELDEGYGETVKVYYGEEFKLATATASDFSKVFAGWFSEPNCQGIQYTDQTGLGAFTWRTSKNVTVYAGWVELFQYNLIKNTQDITKKEYAVVKGEGINYVTEVKVPAYYTENGVTYPVTTIDLNAFFNSTKIRKIELPDTLTTVADNAFAGCSSLRAINVYHVEDEEGKIHTVNYASFDGVLYERQGANAALRFFPLAKTGEYDIPAIIVFGQEEKEIGGVKQLVDVELKVTNIPQDAFKNTNLTRVEIPYTVATVQRSAFDNCVKLEEIVFTHTPEGEAEVALEIRKQAFYNCTALKDINFPARLARILDDNDVEGYTAFDGCTSLEAINVEEKNSTVGKYISSNGALVLKDGEYKDVNGKTQKGNVLVYCPIGKKGQFIVENNIKAIGQRAFNLGDTSATSSGSLACKYITEVVISGSVEEIQEKAFFYLSTLTSVKFEGVEDDSPLAIRGQAFYYCSGLTKLTLPENLKVLETAAFGSTSALLDVTINAAVTEVEAAGLQTGAFGTLVADSSVATYYVTKLTIGPKVGVIEVAGIFGQKIDEIVVDDENTSYEDNGGALYSKGLKKIIYFPLTMSVFNAPEDLEEVAANVFKGNTLLKEIHLGKNVTRIGESAFAGCTGIETLIIDGAEQGETRADLIIDKFAFQNTSTTAKLKNVQLPEGTKSIGDYAFGYAKIEKMYIPSTVELLGEVVDGKVANHVFYRNYYMTEYIVAEGNENYKSVDGALYGTDEDGKATILYSFPASGSGNEGVVTIPETVTEVYEEAFFYMNYYKEDGDPYVKKVIFTGEHENFVVGNQAFYYANQVEEIVLPIGLKEIGYEMFYYCQGLKKLEVPYTVNSIGTKAFYYCNALKSIDFTEVPESEDVADYPLVIEDAYYESTAATTGKTTIYRTYSYGAIYYCLGLEEIVLPERTTRIGRFAFASCSALKKVTVPTTVTSIGAGAFYGCKALEEVVFTPLADGQKAENYPLTLDDGIAIATAYRTDAGVPSGGAETEAAAAAVFYNCSSLVKCDLPERTIKVGLYAFNKVNTLAQFTFPSTLKEIGAYAFNGTAIKDAQLKEGLERIGKNAFANNEALAKAVIPSTVASIGSGAFYKCSALAELTFADGDTPLNVVSDTNIGAFQNTGITAVELPARLTAVGKNMFRFCRNLETVTFADNSNIATIGEGAFAQTVITEFSFPETVDTIEELKLGESLFEKCTDLEKVTLTKAIRNVSGIFKGCNSITEIAVDEESQNFSVNPANKMQLLNKNGTAIRYILNIPTVMNIPEGIQELGDYLFEGSTELTQVIIPTTMNKIGDHVFDGCTELEQVTFKGTNLVSIGMFAFANCSKLTTIALPEGLKTLGSEIIDTTSTTEKNVTTTITQVINNAGYIFNNCTALVNVTLPSTLEVIGSYTFAGCTSLKEITIPNSIETLGSKESLTTVTASSSGTTTEVKNTVVSYLFSNCSALETVNLPTTLKEIGSRTFNKCTALKTITIPETVEYIGKYAFYGCELIKEFTLPKGIEAENIEERIFQNCFALETVNLNGLTAITEGMFYNCFALQNVIGMDKVTAIKEEGFYDCYAFAGDGKGYVDLSKVTEIGNKAFYFCANIKEVVIGEGLEIIGGQTIVSTTAGTVTEVDPEGEEMNDYYNGKISYSSNAAAGLVEKIGGVIGKIIGSSSDDEESGDPGDINEGKTVGGPGITSTAKGSMAFYGCVRLEKVTLPTTCKKLNSFTFGQCRALKEINLENVKEIYGYAFHNTAIEKADLMALDVLSTYVFLECSALKEVTFAKKVAFKTATGGASTSTYVFKDCTALEKVTFNDQQDIIPGYMFNGCTSLKVVTFPGDKLNDNAEDPYVSLPSKVTKVYSNVFDGCSSIVHFNAPAKLTVNGSSSSILTTASYVFRDCTSLKTATFNKDQTVFGTNYFQNCTALETFDISTAVKVPAANKSLIANYLFEGCPKVKFTTANTNFKIINGSVYSADGKTLYLAARGTGEFVFGNDCTKIAAYSFAGCNSDRVVIPQTITTFENYAFAHSDIKAIEFPKDMPIIGDNSTAATYMLIHAEKLEEVILPENLEIIGNYMLEYCYALESVEIPETVQALNTYALAYSGIKEIVVPEGVTTFGTYVFSGCESLAKLTLPETLTTIGNYSFKGSAIKEFTLKNYESIGTYLFQDCINLEKVVIEEGVTAITTYMFEGCTSLKEVNIPEGVTSIGNYAFSGCELITEFDLPETLTTIGNYAFKGTSITELDLKVYESLGTYVFQDCKKLEKVTIEEGYTSLPKGTFSGCEALTEIVFPSTLVDIGDSAFSKCTALETVVFNEGLEAIGLSAFESCTALKNVVLPSTLTNLRTVSSTTAADQIKSKAFANCTALETIWLPESIDYLGNLAFDACTALKTIYVEKAEEEINEGVDMPCWYNDGTIDWISNVPNKAYGETRDVEVKYGYTYQQYLAEITK